MRTQRTLGLLGAVAMLAMSCSAGSSSANQAPATSINIRSFAFTPRTLSIPVGTQVTWTNQDDITHTVTSGAPGTQGVPGVSKDAPPSPDGTFDQELAGAGTTATVAFDHAGTFTYFCRIHAGMTGEITVA
jgi:plastocyanin